MITALRILRCIDAVHPQLSSACFLYIFARQNDLLPGLECRPRKRNVDTWPLQTLTTLDRLSGPAGSIINGVLNLDTKLLSCFLCGEVIGHMKWLLRALSVDSNVQFLHFFAREELSSRLTKVNWERLKSLIPNIGHRTYASSTTVATIKQRLVTEWPQDKSVIPKSASDMKLIHAGKVLENSKTLSESRVHFGDLPGGVITMHVVVQPPVAKKKTDKNQQGEAKAEFVLVFYSLN
ncbi:hypothetical protein F0562_021356 [Nyssa sinensis]|uniref:Ubiquitin-like domain-containing protein n=1 Tax=Nyssa sinensis TaxID=561372 RepID=A0A5J5BK08_9ASTE|nr:hypothetical protein F0562_021356 [Nyssa sinensis]